jgi:hypothetical protein
MRCPRPEAMTEATADRVDIWLIGVVDEVCFELIDVDWRHNLEKLWVVVDCGVGYLLRGGVQLAAGRWWR